MSVSSSSHKSNTVSIDTVVESAFDAILDLASKRLTDYGFSKDVLDRMRRIDQGLFKSLFKHHWTTNTPLTGNTPAWHGRPDLDLGLSDAEVMEGVLRFGHSMMRTLRDERCLKVLQLSTQGFYDTINTERASCTTDELVKRWQGFKELFRTHPQLQTLRCTRTGSADAASGTSGPASTPAQAAPSKSEENGNPDSASQLALNDNTCVNDEGGSDADTI